MGESKFHTEYQEGFYYHIFNHGSSNKDLFLSDIDYQDFYKKYIKYFSDILETTAYCLMPNHYHFLVKIKNKDEILSRLSKKQDSKVSKSFCSGNALINDLISDQFRRFHSSFSLAYNFRNKDHGQLFLNRHKRTKINSEKQLIDTICYIHRNPIHHDFVVNYDQWDYSSFSSFIHEGFEGINLNYSSKKWIELHLAYKERMYK